MLPNVFEPMKEAYYFTHDSNARNDIKVIRLRRSLGLEGYGIYFCLIEMLREQNDYRLPLVNIPDIAFDLNTSEEKVKAVVASFDLFLIENERFFSARLLRNMSDLNEKRIKLSEAGKMGNLARWETHRKVIANGSHGDSEAMASGSPPDRIKGKKSKANESKEKKYAFSDFWEAYGKKTGKKNTQAHWERLSLDDQIAAIEKMNNHKAGKEPKYWKDPERYLKDRRWEDETTGITPNSPHNPNRKAIRVMPDRGCVVFDDGSYKVDTQQVLQSLIDNPTLLETYQ